MEVVGALYVDDGTNVAGAKVFNFTLQPDSSEVWSDFSDFGLQENMIADSYMSNDQLRSVV